MEEVDRYAAWVPILLEAKNSAVAKRQLHALDADLPVASAQSPARLCMKKPISGTCGTASDRRAQDLLVDAGLRRGQELTSVTERGEEGDLLLRRQCPV